MRRVFFVFIPLLGAIVALGVLVWTLVAMVIAVRQALDFTTRRAVTTCLVGWLALFVLLTVLSWIA